MYTLNVAYYCYFDIHTVGNPRHLTYKITELTDKIYKREREMAKKRECMCDDDRGGDTELIDTSDSAVLHIKLNTCQL